MKGDNDTNRGSRCLNYADLYATIPWPSSDGGYDNGTLLEYKGIHPTLILVLGKQIPNLLCISTPSSSRVPTLSS